MVTAVALPGHEVVGIVAPGELVELGIVQSVLIAGVPWFETRQTCKLVHDYLAGAIRDTLEEYRACSGYAAGVCRGTGGARLLCLFHEADQSLAWAKARQWRHVQLSDGTTALEQRQQY